MRNTKKLVKHTKKNTKKNEIEGGGVRHGSRCVRPHTEGAGYKDGPYLILSYLPERFCWPRGQGVQGVTCVSKKRRHHKCLFSTQRDT